MKETFNPKVVCRNPPRGPKRRRTTGQARGERIAGAVLSEDMVRTIRAMRQGLGYGATRIQQLLAAEGVELNVRTIGNVIGYRTWRHVT